MMLLLLLGNNSIQFSYDFLVFYPCWLIVGEEGKRVTLDRVIGALRNGCVVNEVGGGGGGEGVPGKK